MKVLVTGDRGYIGPILVNKLLEIGHEVVGIDTNFFSEPLISTEKPNYQQLIGDIRDIQSSQLSSFQSVIHLAGLSNDPLGELNPNITDEINFKATVNLAKQAKKAGVSRFVYASSQSIYGVSKVNDELDEDHSLKNPITEYAIAKWKSEQVITPMNSSDFVVTCLRPATVFGASPNLRSDVVFNNMMACAYLTGNIEVKSDGTPLRPVVHVEDVSEAFIAGMLADGGLLEEEVTM